MTDKQLLERLGELAREIVLHDRETARLRAGQVLELELGRVLRDRRTERRRLSDAAARLCSRVLPLGGGRPTAVSVSR